MYEAAVEREKEIDHRAKAVEASLRASVDGFDARIRSVEERVNSALAGFRAQMENDIKMSTDSMAKMLLDLEATRFGGGRDDGANLAARVLENGECLFIHCWGGKGRTGLVAACLLGLLYESLGAEEALDRVQAYAETRTKSIVSPETDPQRDQVRAIFAAVRGGP